MHNTQSSQPKSKPASPLEEACARKWQASASLREEFGNDFEAYVAYEDAMAQGLVKIQGGRPR